MFCHNNELACAYISGVAIVVALTAIVALIDSIIRIRTKKDS